jgi:hypothetical protein
MAFILEKANEKSRRLIEKAGELALACEQLLHDIERDEQLLDMFSDPTWKRFIEKVLVPQMDYIAHKNMKLSVDDRDNRLRSEGAYDKMKVLSRSHATLQADIDLNRQELARKRDELTGTNQQINKIKE